MFITISSDVMSLEICCQLFFFKFVNACICACFMLLVMFSSIICFVFLLVSLDSSCPWSFTWMRRKRFPYILLWSKWLFLVTLQLFWKWGLDLLNKYCRRERHHSEAEKAQHIKQIHDFQEHIQEKERQLIELQEQFICVYGVYFCCHIQVKVKTSSFLIHV
jgi:hypothetical protein